MSDPRRTYGIDVGTRTVVVYCYDHRLNSDYVVKIHGEEYGPSAYLDQGGGRILLGRKAVDFAREEPDAASKLCTGFKLGFWVRKGRSGSEVQAAGVHLRAFLRALREYLARDAGADFDSSRFCFSHPAQCDAFQDEFKRLVAEAGFTGDDIHFIDECTAAVWGLGCEDDRDSAANSNTRGSLRSRVGRHFLTGSEEDSSKKQVRAGDAPDGLGLLIDIGAGTTDIAVVMLQESSLNVLASCSTDVAGNTCTAALGNLAVLTTGDRSSPRERWAEFVRSDPTRADQFKEENFSRFYRDVDQRESPAERPLMRNGIKLHSRDFAQFRETVKEISRQIAKLADQSIVDAKMGAVKVEWILLVGGGAQHSGLVDLLRERYPGIVSRARDSRILTARGAASYIASKYARKPFGVALRSHPTRVTITIQDSVMISFPGDSGGGSFALFLADEEIDVSVPEVSRTHSVRLKSNFFSKEGGVYVSVGSIQQKLGDLDIDWSIFGESNNHPAVVHGVFDPETKMLSIRLNTANVKTHEQVAGSIQLRLKSRGRFDHAD